MRKIFLRNLIQILSPIMLCILVMAGLLLPYQYRQTVTSQRQYTKDVLYQTQEAFEKNLDHVNTVALTLSFNNNKNLIAVERLLNRDYLTNAQAQELEELLTVVNATFAANRNVKSIYVYLENAQQKLYATDLGCVRLSDFYDQDWYAVYREAKDVKSLAGFFHSVSRFGFEGQRDVISVIRMLPATQLKHRGAVVLNMDTRVFTAYLDNINLPEDVQFRIRDPKGETLFCYNGGDDAVTGEELVLPSKVYEWEYVLYTSGLAIFDQFRTTLTFVVGFMIISSVAGLIAALVLTYRRQARLQGVLAMLEEHGYHLSSDKRSFTDEYGYLNKHIAQILLELGQQKYQMRVLQLEAAQYQMTPHFLFNTLETILFQCMDLTNSANAASDMVSRLSTVLKYSLRSPDGQVTLQTELDMVEVYGQIMRTRYEGKFALEYDTTPESLSCRVPKMFIQPLVENSIYYGAREKDGFTVIRVSAQVEKGKLILRVVDDGAGITPERLAVVRSGLGSTSKSSIGLSNIYRRLETLYGTDFAMEINSLREGGMEVYIAMPAEYILQFK